MENETVKSNQAVIMGEIVSDFRYSHQAYGEKIYMSEVSVKRLSNYEDVIPVAVSERFIDPKQSYTGRFVWMGGQFRSHNRKEEKKRHLILAFFVQEMEFLTEIPEEEESNYIFLDGYICKKPVYRNTPLGREITDILLAVNRSYGRSDYIPCICWEKNARYASRFKVGEHVRFYGRIQSREYVKKIPGAELKDTMEQRTAYEVSVSRMEVYHCEKGVSKDENKVCIYGNNLHITCGVRMC